MVPTCPCLSFPFKCLKHLTDFKKYHYYHYDKLRMPDTYFQALYNNNNNNNNYYYYYYIIAVIVNCN